MDGSVGRATSLQRTTSPFGLITARDRPPGEVVRPEPPTPAATPGQPPPAAWNQTDTPYPADLGVHALVEAQVERTPDAVALECGRERLTYRELNELADRLAGHLVAAGVGAGGLVGIATERSTAMVAGILAILKAGAAYVPLDPEYPAERLAFMLDDAGLSIVLADRASCGRLPASAARLLLFEELADPPPADGRPARSASGEDRAYVLYTSGSTGRPKGVEIPHRAVVNFLTAMRERPGLSADDVVLSVTTMCFDIAVLELFLPLTIGARVVVVSREVASDGKRLRAALDSSDATVMQATPSSWRLLLAAGWVGRPGLKILCGGEPLIWPLANQLLERGDSLWNMYGPTETTVWSTVHEVRPAVGATGMVPIGRPIGNTRLYLLDEEGQPVAIGRPGELYIGGAGVALGYLGRPDLTAERFRPDPFGPAPDARMYRTGDLALYRTDGTLEFLGRVDDQVKIRGARVELGEIESMLAQAPGVREAIAVARGAEDARSLVAYTVAQPGQAPSPAEMRSFLSDRLPRHMVPSIFVTIDALPLTPNGKVDRAALPEPGWLASRERRGYLPPRDATERRLIELWEDGLSVQPIGARDNFFDLGGHSLQAVRVFARIEELWRIRLPVTALLRAPTVEQLAVLVRDGVAPSTGSSLVPIQLGGSRPPLFCVHALGGGILDYARLAPHLAADQPLYGLQAREGVPFATIEAMAAAYVQEVRTVRPEGPYLLAGYSAGGVVAFEMARLLEAAGRPVPFLALIEAAPDSYYAAPRTPLQLARFAANLPVWLGDLAALGPRAGLARARRILRVVGRTITGQRGPLALDEVFDDVSALPASRIRSAEQFARALTRYRPGRFGGRVTLFRVRRQPLVCSHDPAMGWRELAAGGVELQAVSGNHLTMFEEPHVKTLASQLGACLERV